MERTNQSRVERSFGQNMMKILDSVWVPLVSGLMVGGLLLGQSMLV